MVQVRVMGAALDPAQQYVLLLKPLDDSRDGGDAATGDKVLPVWIGAQEATSILVAVQGVTPPRPLAHDLMATMLGALHGTVDHVEVTRIDDGTYYAEVTVDSPQGTVVIDARPSDAIALASRTGASIFVADEVMEEAGVHDELSGADDAVSEEERVEQFKEFLEDVDPDDFRG